MIDRALKTQPPRRLRGRKARKFWRELSPLVTTGNTLHAIIEPQLACLCILLERVSGDPDDIHDDDLTKAEKLAKALGLRS